MTQSDVLGLVTLSRYTCFYTTGDVWWVLHSALKQWNLQGEMLDAEAIFKLSGVAECFESTRESRLPLLTIYNLCLYPHLGTVQSRGFLIYNINIQWFINVQPLSASVVIYDSITNGLTTHKWIWFGCVGPLEDWLPWSEKWTWGQRKRSSECFAERAVIDPAVVTWAGHRRKWRKPSHAKEDKTFHCVIQLHLIRFCLLVQKKGGKNSWRWELQTEASRKH